MVAVAAILVVKTWRSDMPVSGLSQPPRVGLTRGMSLIVTPLTSGSRRCDSCRGGVEGQRSVNSTGFFSLWKRGRKRRWRPTPLHCVRCSLSSAVFPRSLQQAPAPTAASAAPSCALEDTCQPGHSCWDPDVSPHPLAACSEGSIVVQIPQEGEILKRAGFALKIKSPFKCQLPWCRWVCPLATGRATVAKDRWPTPGHEWRDPKPQLGRWIIYIKATEGRRMCLTCHISGNP